MNFKNIIKSAILLFSIILSTKGFALVGVGSMSPFIGQYTTNLAGETESPFTLQPYLSLHEFFNVTGSIFFIPEVGMTLPSSSYSSGDAFNGDGDQASSRQMTFILANFSYMFSSGSHLRFGLGTFMTTISGDGGAVTRNDGGGTALHYLPDQSVTSYNTTINLGFEQFFRPGMAFKLESYIWNILSSESRRFNFSLAFNYYL